jgi:acyl-CoA synthetase (NDP forming)
MSELRGFRPRNRRIGIVSEGGGQGALAADLSSKRQLIVPELSPKLRDSVAAALGSDLQRSNNPVDLHVHAGPAAYERVARLLLQSGEVEQVLLAGSFGELFAMKPEGANVEQRAAEWAAARSLVELQQTTHRGVVVQTFHPTSDIAKWMAEQSVVTVRRLSEAVDALVASAPKEEEVPGWLGRVNDAARPVGYMISRERLAHAGIPFARAEVVSNEAELIRLFGALEGRVVLKAVDQLHKSQDGGVRVGISRVDDAVRHFEELSTSRSGTIIVIESDESRPGALELLIGARRTARYGVLGIVGMGGVLAEVLDDIAIVSRPLTVEKFAMSLAGLRGWNLFEQQLTSATVEAAHGVLLSLFELLIADPSIQEAEVNPLLCHKDGVIALDARIMARLSRVDS